MYVDIVIVNGKCMTMENDGTWDWIAVKDGKIFELGEGHDYMSLVDDPSIVIDAAGKTVMPGFIDSHFHLVQTAMNEKSVNLNNVKSFEEIGKLIREQEIKNPGECIFGVRLDNADLKEGVFPDRMVLDKFSNNVPVCINSLDYQVSMLNTYGLLYYKIPFYMNGVEMDENGVATGIIRGRANAALRTDILNNYSDRKRYTNVSDIIPKLLEAGITSINDMEGGYMYSDRDAEFIYEHQKDFPIDITLFYQCLDLNKVQEKRLTRIGGSMYVDGTMGARTAALTFEYADCPGEMGSLIFSQNELNEFVTECYLRHLQLSLYTIGDRAIDTALKAHEYAFYKTGIVGLRHRLEHVELAGMEHIKKAGELGIIFSMNPTYETYWGGPDKMYRKRIGERYKGTNKFREIIEQGVILCGGSDSDICDYNPFTGIHAAVNHPVKEHRIGVEDALKMYTINGAYAIFEENIKGSLRKGKTADIIVLDRDLSKVKNEDLDKVKVECTIKSGELIFNRL